MATKPRQARQTSAPPKTGAVEFVLPSGNLAGKSRSKSPTSSLDRGQSVRNTLRTYAANAINNVRNRTDIIEMIRTLMREDGLFSSASNSMVALASGAGFRIAAYNSTGAMDIGVMSAAYTMLDRFSSLDDYTRGFSDKQGLQNLISTLQTDVIGTGGCGAELVLDKAFGPERLVPVGYSTITWEADGKGGKYPTQDSGKVKLNFPTIFISEHCRNAEEAYSTSILRPALNHTINFNEFLEDLHRSVNRTGHSRLIATVIAEKVWAAAPDDVKADPSKREDYFNEVRESVEDALAELEPEDAIVGYDSVEYEVKDTGGSKADYSALLTTLGNLLGAALKTPASVSGLRAGGGQGLSNAETLVYLKVIEAVRAPVEDVLSRALTLALRLIGVDGYASFEFMPVNLRPEEELEAYKSTRQKRVLELLSFGLINDAQACYELGIRPQGMVALLAGTGFYGKQVAAADEGMKDGSDGEEGERVSSSGKALNPSTPSKSGGSDQ